MTNYPAKIDTTQSLPTAIDGITPVQGLVFNRLRDAVIAIEEELGLNPAGVYGSLAARLGILENVTGNLRIIELDGDLGGTLETPKVIALQGLPISDAVPNPFDVLTWDGIAWIPAPAQGGGGGGGSVHFGGDLSGNSLTQTVVGLHNHPVLFTQSPQLRDTLTWDGGEWNTYPTPPVTELILRQGDPSADNFTKVFDNWSQVMAVRNQISGPVRIIIDDSIQSPVTVDVGTGTWDLKNNTAIVGYKSGSSTPVLQISTDISLLNPCYFQDLTIVDISADPGQFGIDTTTSSINFTARNVTFQCIASGNLVNYSAGGNINLYDCIVQSTQTGSAFYASVSTSGIVANINAYGNTTFENAGNPCVYMGLNNSSSTLNINLLDTSVIQSQTINSIGPDGYGNNNIRVGEFAQASDVQSGTKAITWLLGNFVGNWSAASNGAVLTKTGDNTTDWVLVASTPSPVLIFAPGQTASGNTYNTWSSVMAARAAIPGPVTIYVDDSSGAANVAVGNWDLLNTTAIAGIRKSAFVQFSPSTNTLNIPEGAQLQNPSEFRDLQIIGFGTTIPSIDVTGSEAISPNTMEFKAYNVIFALDASATQPLLHSFAGCNISLFESSHFLNPGGTTNNSFILSNLTQHNYTLNLYDGTIIDANTINITNVFLTIFTVNIYDLAVKFSTTQSVAVTMNINGLTAGGDLGGSFPNATVSGLQGFPISSTSPNVGQVLEWNGSDWTPTNLPASLPPSGPAGGSLAGTYPNPTVSQLDGYAAQDYGGAGTKAYILATETRSGVAPGADDANRVDSFINSLTVVADGYFTIASVGLNGTGVNPSGDGCCDFALSFLAIDNSLLGNKFWRADMTFTAYWNAGVITLYNGAGSISVISPTNIRSNGTSYQAQAIASGNQVLIQVKSGNNNVNWSCMGQLQWVR